MLGRHIQIKFVKDDDVPRDLHGRDKNGNYKKEDPEALTKEDIQELTTGAVKKVTVGVVAVMTARTILKTSSQVAIELAKKPVICHCI